MLGDLGVAHMTNAHAKEASCQTTVEGESASGWNMHAIVWKRNGGAHQSVEGKRGDVLSEWFPCASEAIRSPMARKEMATGEDANKSTNPNPMVHPSVGTEREGYGQAELVKVYWLPRKNECVDAPSCLLGRLRSFESFQGCSIYSHERGVVLDKHGVSADLRNERLLLHTPIAQQKAKLLACLDGAMQFLAIKYP